MFRSLWFHHLLSLRRSRRVRRREAAQERRSVSPRLEGLEDRITPSGGPPLPFATPTNGSQLQQDINWANTYSTAKYTIKLSSHDTYTLSGDQAISNTAGLIFQGNGATIHADTLHRLFTVAPGANVTFANVTLTGGDTVATTGGFGGGGGILDRGGNVTLSAANVTGNVAHGTFSGALGGGVYVSQGGALTVKNGSSISDNRAIGSSPFVTGSNTFADGGGVYVSGNSAITISGSSITYNLAKGGNSTVSTGGSAGGGGLYIAFDNSPISITGSHIDGNVAQGGNTFNTNPAQNAGLNGGNALGGGLTVISGGYNLSIQNSTVSNNSAIGGLGSTGHMGTNSSGDTAGGGNGGSAFGGGAYVSGLGSSFTLLGVAFNNDSAAGGGGGKGGVGQTANPHNAGGMGGGGGNGGGAFGGALSVFNIGGINLSITNSSFTNSHATGGVGGAGGTGGAGATTSSGIVGVTIIPPGPGGTGGNGGFAGGGGVFVSGVGLNLLNSTLGANSAQGGNGGAAGAGGKVGNVQAGPGQVGIAGAAEGGGLFDFSTATLDNDTIAFNSALAGAVGRRSATPTGGGGIQTTSSTTAGPTLTNVMLESNSTNGSGPDISGAIGLTSSNDFVSNSAGLTDASALAGTQGMIFNVAAAQLGPLTFSSGGLGYYALLSSSVAIDGGTNATLAAIAQAEGVSTAQATDEIGDPRVINGTMDIGAIEFGASQGGGGGGHGHHHHPHP